MMEFLGMMISSATGTAIGNSVPDNALQKPSSESEKADDSLSDERASFWRDTYMKRCRKMDGNLDKLKLIKFDALVVSFRRGEITYREFSDELDRLDNPGPL